jgi:hypothetical protein
MKNSEDRYWIPLRRNQLWNILRFPKVCCQSWNWRPALLSPSTSEFRTSFMRWQKVSPPSFSWHHSTLQNLTSGDKQRRRPWRIKHTFFSKEQLKDQKHVCYSQRTAVFMSFRVTIRAAKGSREDVAGYSGHFWRSVAVRNLLTSTQHCNTMTEITAVTWDIWGSGGKI